MRRYIVIEYDPKKCAGGEPMDLYDQLVKQFALADVDAFVVEFKRRPTAEKLGEEFGGNWR